MATDSADGVTEYTYDALGQLLTETKGSQTVSVTYDKYGNIQSKNGIPYSYGSDDANCCGWKDLLTAYNGKAITYDAYGNPINYQGTAATWEKGRQLKTFGANSYKYNNEGIRIQKQTATEIHDYILDGSNIVKEIVSTTAHVQKYVNEYLYDLDGTVCGIKYNDTAYYFYKNLQGDVIAITDANGATVAQYTYDAWGVPTIKSDTSGCNIAPLNPFRYRSYYYDTETKFYYLQSRYYNPEVGRFINADDVDVLNDVTSVIEGNLFAYCHNNAVNDKDALGNSIAAKVAKIILSVVAELYIQLFKDLFKYLIKKYVKKENIEFEPDPKDYISVAVQTALDCINPFAGKKRAKLIYNIICPAIFVIIDHVWEYAKGKQISFKSLGLDLLFSVVSGFIDLAMDKKTEKEIQKIKKWYRGKKKRSAFARRKLEIKAEFKAFGKKIKVGFQIAQFIIDFFSTYIFDDKKEA